MRRFAALGATVMLVLCATLAEPTASLSRLADTTEYQVKAAFIYNFVKFVQWPADAFLEKAGASISLCILGRDELGDALEGLNGKSAQGRIFSVRRIDRPGEADRCQVLYLCRSERERMRAILKGIKAGVLTIGDMKSFASAGGIINFVLTQKKVSFEINVEAAEKAGLKISSQLLKLAKIVKEGDGREER